MTQSGICKFFLQDACHRGNSCPYSHSIASPSHQPQPRKLCAHFQRGTCTFGDKCLDLHQLQACNFFSQGRCTKGNDCPFSHSQQSVEDCRFWKQGKCKKGPACPFKHDVHDPWGDLDDSQTASPERIVPETSDISHNPLPDSSPDIVPNDYESESLITPRDETSDDTLISGSPSAEDLIPKVVDLPEDTNNEPFSEVLQAHEETSAQVEEPSPEVNSEPDNETAAASVDSSSPVPQVAREPAYPSLNTSFRNAGIASPLFPTSMTPPNLNYPGSAHPPAQYPVHSPLPWQSPYPTYHPFPTHHPPAPAWPPAPSQVRDPSAPLCQLFARGHCPLQYDPGNPCRLRHFLTEEELSVVSRMASQSNTLPMPVPQPIRSQGGWILTPITQGGSIPIVVTPPFPTPAATPTVSAASAPSPVTSPASTVPLPSICIFYQEGRCRNAEQCPYRHELLAENPDSPASTSLAKQPCKFFPTGTCTKGPACYYSHDLTSSATAPSSPSPSPSAALSPGNDGREHTKPRGASSKTCKYYASGSCKKGPNCSFSHDSLPENKEAINGNTGDGWNPGTNDDATTWWKDPDDASGWGTATPAKDQSAPPSGSWGAIDPDPWSTPPTTPLAPPEPVLPNDNVEKNTHTVERQSILDDENTWKTAWSENSESAPGRSKINQPCIYFGQGYCRFGEECNYLHLDQPDVEVDSRGMQPDKVTVCISSSWSRVLLLPVLHDSL